MIRDCASGCGRPVTAKGRTTKYCEPCRAADPHRHRARAARIPQMFVSVDCEGVQDGKIMSLTSASYGREDGTSGSIITKDGKIAARWMIDNLSGHYQGGREYRQVPVGFHLNWDMAIIARDFDGADMTLIHAATGGKKNLLCDTKLCDHKKCGKLPRHDYKLTQAFITDGGEAGIIAWDPQSKIGIATTPRRRLYLEARPHGDRYEGRRTCDIHDTGSAFYGSLLQVLDFWRPESTPEQRAIIEWGKEARSTGEFATATPAKVAAYSEAETVLHARVCRLLIDAIRVSAGIPITPVKLFGAGSIAAAAMKYHKVQKRKNAHTDGAIIDGLALDDIPRFTYFGGVIEAPVVGFLTGMTDEVDLNSAYPSVQVDLPCMRKGHGKWEHTRNASPAPSGAVGHVLATWDVQTPSTPPFVVRTATGSVCQPLTGLRVWVTLAEYQAAKDHFGTSVTCDEAVWWVPECECEHPFEWMAELYQRRLNVKTEMNTLKRGTPEWWQLNVRQAALKQVLASCYGKLAQTRPTLGPYTNLHWASHITGETRAKVRRETWLREQQGGEPVYQHTDSVLSRGGNPVDAGTALGAWGMEKPSRNFLIIQPGLATALGGGKTASRGCAKKPFQEAIAKWATRVDFTRPPDEWESLEIPRHNMISRRMAISRGKPELAGSFEKSTLTVRATSGKRDFTRATPIPGTGAWAIPPVQMVYQPATMDTLKACKTAVDRAIHDGKYDDTTLK